MSWISKWLSPHKPLCKSAVDAEAQADRLSAEIDKAASERSLEDAHKAVQKAEETRAEHVFSRRRNNYGRAIDTHYRGKHGHGPATA